MKKLLRLVLFSALLFGGLNLSAQTPDIKVDRENDFTLIKILNSYHWPYDISNNKKYVAIQGFGATDSYYWSEETGAVAISGYGYAISDDGKMAGTFSNNLGYNVAGIWSPETKQWEFLGMNPDMPEFSTVEGDFEYNGAWSMTNDGSKIGIMQVYPDWSTTSYIWTEEEGYVQLPNGISPGTRPNAFSDDGRVIAGLATHEDKGEWTPCYWIDNEIYRLPHLFGEALNVSHNGKYICGYLLNKKAFLYEIADDKLVTIANTLEPEFQVSATCVTDNGIIFGYSDGGSPADRKAVAYAGGELMYFTEYLKLNGVEEAANWIIYSINNVTADGKTFIGAGLIDGSECSFVLTIEGSSCNAPTDLTYIVDNTKYDFDDIVLSWTAPMNNNDLTYDLYINYTGAPFISGITETSLVLNDMAPGEYQFLVRANNGDCVSDASNMVRPTIYPCAENDKCEITIVKKDYYNDGWDNGYISIKGTKSDIEYQIQSTEGESYEWPIIETLSLSPDTYTFTWVKGNWDEEVGFIINFNNEEIYNVEIGGITADFELKFLEYDINCENEANVVAPTNIVAVPESDSAIKLNWEAAENATSYNVYISGDFIDFVGNTTETEYVVNGLDADTEYCFVISSVNDNESELSDEACAKTLPENIAELTSSFNIYPNPVENQLFISTEENLKEISIFTITGVMVYSKQTMDNGQQSIDVANLNSGIYFIKVKTANGEIVKRFVKK